MTEAAKTLRNTRLPESVLELGWNACPPPGDGYSRIAGDQRRRLLKEALEVGPWPIRRRRARVLLPKDPLDDGLDLGLHHGVKRGLFLLKHPAEEKSHQVPAALKVASVGKGQDDYISFRWSVSVHKMELEQFARETRKIEETYGRRLPCSGISPQGVVIGLESESRPAQH